MAQVLSIGAGLGEASCFAPCIRIPRSQRFLFCERIGREDTPQDFIGADIWEFYELEFARSSQQAISAEDIRTERRGQAFKDTIQVCLNRQIYQHVKPKK